MKTRLFSTLLLGAAVELSAAASMHRLQVELMPRFNGAPLVFDAVMNTTAAGQRVSVTRLDFLLSNIALHRADGAWLGLTNWFAYISAREGRTGFELNNIPAGRYDRLRFQVGVSANFNHADPAQHPPGHPLNPTVNGLHWNWQGGYVFFAIEGSWQTGDGKPGGYSYHITNDRQFMTVERPVELNLAASRELNLTLDVAKVFAGTHSITLDESTATTHSREGDELAAQLSRNITHAFDVAKVNSFSPSEQVRDAVKWTPQSHPTGGSTVLLMATNAAPYRLTFSGFFSPPALPDDNPLTEEGVLLGALLFFDPRLSVNNSQSCASCHNREAAFSHAPNAVSRGAEGHTGTRNAMPLFNLAWKSSFFWDGRAASLREQVLQPIQNPIEMHETLESVVAKVARSRVNARHRARALADATQSSEPDTRLTPLNSSAEASTTGYWTLFADAFGTPVVTSDRIARALEQFLLTQVSCNSKFDRFTTGGTNLTAQEQRGFELFHTEYDPRRGQFGADCFHCHGGPLFQSQSFANNGLDTGFKDLGRYQVTKKDGDKGKFAVPSLRNIAFTAPYMHDGRFATLEEVVEHYSTGVKRSATLDPNLAKHPEGGVPLSASDKTALVTFLKMLTDVRFRANATDGSSVSAKGNAR